MKLFTNITKDNAAYYAATVYDNPQFVKEEQFARDFRRVSMIKKYMNKFDNSIEINNLDHLVHKIVNIVVSFLNTFGRESGLRIMFALMEERFWMKLVPIVEHLTSPDSYLTVEGVNNQVVILESVEQDEFFSSIVNKMREYEGLYRS